MFHRWKAYLSDFWLCISTCFPPYNRPVSLKNTNHISMFQKKNSNLLINYLLSLGIREVVKHLIDHVDAAEAYWKMRHSVNSVRQHVTWQLMSSVMYVLFVKKVVSSVAGYLILVSMLNQYWLWSLQQSRLWDVRLEITLLHLGSAICVYVTVATV